MITTTGRIGGDWVKTDNLNNVYCYLLQCRELYFCVKEAMEKAAARNNGKVPGLFGVYLV
jgi:hypothetical protein